MTYFNEYTRQGEPDKRERGYAWQTAIGLQAVDGLKPSEYLIETARKHIEGDITIEEAQERIKGYYQLMMVREDGSDDTEEADKVSANIAKLLSERSLAFTVAGFTAVHRRLFDGVFKFAGKIRDYNITKKEWALRGDTVLYVSAPDIRKAIEYDIEQEKLFNYTGLRMEQVVSHLTKFVSGLWQIHPFGEGNTRTVAVFTIQYLRSMGFDVENDLFANHSWYFRNALVRANYQNVQKGVTHNSEYLERFFRNLLMGEKNELMNRHLIIPEEGDSQSITLDAHPLKELLHAKGYKLILASGSPRRRELLAGLDIPFEVKVLPDPDESYPASLSGTEIPLFIARSKAEAYKPMIEANDLVITADTIVWLDGQVSGKPVDEEDARAMLRHLSGKTHEVITGVCLTTRLWQKSFCTVTTVTFSTLSAEEIEYYVRKYHPTDKAGSYGIQEWIGFIGVERIEGSFFNVMGLPVQRLYRELMRI